jgi:hypothetical protein
MTNLEVGKTYYPPSQEVTITDNLVCGSGWQVEKIGSVFLFEFLAARHGGGVERHNIAADEFELMKQKKLTFADVLKKYDKT